MIGYVVSILKWNSKLLQSALKVKSRDFDEYPGEDNVNKWLMFDINKSATHWT